MTYVNNLLTKYTVWVRIVIYGVGELKDEKILHNAEHAIHHILVV